MLSRRKYGPSIQDSGMQTGICLIAYKGGFVVRCCRGGTPVRDQKSNIGYDILKLVIRYLTGYQLTDHWSLLIGQWT